MASIKSQLTLNDGMSAVLKKITKALDTTLASFEQVQKASGQAMDTKLIQAAHTELAQANREIDEMAENFRQSANEEDKLNDSIARGTSAADGLLQKITSIAAAYVSLSSVKNLITDSLSAADTQIGAQVQLKAVMTNMGTSDYYDDVVKKASEIQSRGIYGDEIMIAGASELSTYFSDGEAIISMMDTLSNYAMGMSGGGELDSTAMVDYATGIGKIMSGSYDAMTKKGFEFSDTQKAIIEGTATEAQIAATLGDEYVDMSNDMQAAAVIGQVIDEGWSGLYETMSATPEGALIQFKNTLGDIKEVIGAGLYPAVLNFMQAFQNNLPMIESLAGGFVQVLGTVMSVLTSIMSGVLNVASFIQSNWSVIAPIIGGIASALLLYNGYLAVTNMLDFAAGVAKGVHAVQAYAAAASSTTLAAAEQAEAMAAASATAAQYGFNAALLSSPVTWIVLAVIALVAAVIALCSWIAKTTGIANSFFGVITGGINVAIQAVKNAGLVVANIALGIWNALSAVCSNIGTAFHNVIANVQGWFYNLLSTALTVVAGICEALNKLPFVEFDFSGISAKADEYAAKSAEAYEGTTDEYTSVADAFNEGFNTFETFADGWVSDAFNAGAAWGDGIADKVGGLFNYKAGTIDDYVNSSGAGLGYDLENIGSDTGDIADSAGGLADSAGGIADSLDVSNEELAYLRDIAERDAVNRFTTAEVKIDMTGMTNRIDSSMDLDGVISQLSDGFAAALVTAAEGVHA